MIALFLRYCLCWFIATAPADDVRVRLASFIIDDRHITLGAEIGRGTFGRVVKGVWNQLPVCAKVTLVLVRMCAYMSSSRHVNSVMQMRPWQP